MIYIIHKILVLLKSPELSQGSIFECFFKEYNGLFLKKENDFLHNI